MSSAPEIRDLIVDLVAESGFGAHGLHVRIGDETAEHRWVPETREEIHSLAKSVCVLAAGIAADEGLISVDAPAAEMLSGIEFGQGSERVTLRHLLSMSSGIDLPWSETMMTDWPDLGVEFFGRPTAGRSFQYSNASTYAAMQVLATRTGDVLDYLTPRLFEPLGIAGTVWERCPNGRVLGGEGIALTTEEIARIGRLIRDRGRWRGEPLVSARWVDAMHTDWVVAGTAPGYARYALSGWDGPGDLWRLHGANGQLVVFKDDAVVTITADDHFGADDLLVFLSELLAR